MEERLQRQPFRREPVEHRHAGDRERADQHGAAAPGQTPQQAAQPVERLEGSERALDGPGPEEQQRLEDGVVDGVQQGGGERVGGPRVGVMGAQQQARTDRERDDPEVLHGRVREQALEVALEERVDDAAERGEGAEREHGCSDPRGRSADPLDQHSDQAIGRDGDHHAAHQRRDVGRGERVRARQPRVHRHQPGLRAEAHDRRERDHGLDGRSAVECRRVSDGALACRQEQRDPGADAAEVRDRDIREDGSPRRLVASADQDQRRRNERHQLPEEQEREGIPGARDTDQREHEGRRERADRAPLARRVEVRRCVHERRAGGQADEPDEQPAEAVDAEVGGQRARERGTRRAAVEHGQHARGSREERADRLHAEPVRQPVRCRRERAAGGEHHQAGEQERRHSEADGEFIRATLGDARPPGSVAESSFQGARSQCRSPGRSPSTSAALISERWLNAWGKLPSCRRATGSYSSESSPRSLRRSRSRSKSSRASS